jgi:Tol biopolymer transport system component
MRVCLLWLGVTSLLCAAPHTILFSRLAPHELGLYIANADGTGEHLLLKSPALDYNPAWSADGQWIAFTSERNGSADLYRAKPDGSALERLTDSPAYDDQAAFSPDGTQIVFVTTRAGGTADLWILDVASKKAHALTSGPGGDFRPSWSPDGKWIAFSSDRGSTLPMAKGRWEHLHIVDIYLIHPDGTGLKRITEHGNFCGSPKWDSASKHVIAYCTSAQETWDYRSARPKEGGNTQLVSIDIATGTSTNVPAGPGVKLAPAFLPSGEVAYVRKDAGGPGIFYRDGKPGPTGVVRSASWSSDGKRVAYHKVLSAGAQDRERAWSRNSEFELINTPWLPAFHPSGERFVATRDGSLSLIEVSTGSARTLWKQDGKSVMAAQYSPKGDEVIFGLGWFFTDRDKGAQVGVIKADGSGYRELTAGANNNGFPSMSPDGKRFVYRTVGPDGYGLRIMNMEDRSVSSLTTDWDNFPLWSPKGDTILFTRKVDGDFEIFTIRPDGKDLKRLTFSPGNEGHCAWSPDGESILFSSARLGFKDEALYTDSPQPYGEVYVMKKDGTNVRQLTDNQWEDAGPAWQPQPAVAGTR